MMRTSSGLAASLLFVCAACGDDASPVADGSTEDASVADGALPDSSIADALQVDSPPGECGTMEPPLAMITGTEGIAIASDGTIYYSQSGGNVGRWVPGSATVDDAWVDLGAGANTVWGMAINSAGELYVASPSNDTIYMIDTTADEPAAVAMTSDAGSPNGLTLGANGDVVWSDFAGGGLVYRLDNGEAVAVSDEGFDQPNGVLFDGSDETLLVLEYSTGVIQRLTLDAGLTETAREVAGSIDGNPDGLAVDSLGRYYVTNNSGGEVIRLDSDFENPEVILDNVGSAANMAFGRGALACDDLYVTSSGALRRIEAGATGSP